MRPYLPLSRTEIGPKRHQQTEERKKLEYQTQTQIEGFLSLSNLFLFSTGGVVGLWRLVCACLQEEQEKNTVCFCTNFDNITREPFSYFYGHYYGNCTETVGETSLVCSRQLDEWREAVVQVSNDKKDG